MIYQKLPTFAHPLHTLSHTLTHSTLFIQNLGYSGNFWTNFISFGVKELIIKYRKLFMEFSHTFTHSFTHSQTFFIHFFTRLASFSKIHGSCCLKSINWTGRFIFETFNHSHCSFTHSHTLITQSSNTNGCYGHLWANFFYVGCQKDCNNCGKLMVG